MKLLQLALLMGTACTILLPSHGHAALKADALTSATTSAVQPAFSGIVLQGPNVMNGAPVAVGQTLQLEVIVMNPWTNNTVTMSLARSLPGMSLVQTSNNQAQPTWVLNWTPDSSEIGANNVSFVTLFRQTSGTNTGAVQTFQPGLPIKVIAGNGYVSDATAIKSLSISNAAWNQKTNTLLVRGQVKLKPGYPLPPSTSITLSYQSGSPIPDPGATVNVSSKNGTWSTLITTLPTGQNPCAIVGVASVEGNDTTAVANKKVTGKAIGCQP